MANLIHRRARPTILVKGHKGGRRPAITAEKTTAVRTACLAGRSIAALAREHGVSRGAIRTVIADPMPEHTEADSAAASVPSRVVVGIVWVRRDAALPVLTGSSSIRAAPSARMAAMCARSP